MKKDNTATFVRKVLKKLNIKSSPKMENLFIQIFKFCIVGGTASIIDFGLLYIFRDICKLDILIANTLSFCISVIYFVWFLFSEFYMQLSDTTCSLMIFFKLSFLFAFKANYQDTLEIRHIEKSIIIILYFQI